MLERRPLAQFRCVDDVVIHSYFLPDEFFSATPSGVMKSSTSSAPMFAMSPGCAHRRWRRYGKLHRVSSDATGRRRDQDVGAAARVSSDTDEGGPPATLAREKRDRQESKRYPAGTWVR